MFKSNSEKCSQIIPNTRIFGGTCCSKFANLGSSTKKWGSYKLGYQLVKWRCSWYSIPILPSRSVDPPMVAGCQQAQRLWGHLKWGCCLNPSHILLLRSQFISFPTLKCFSPILPVPPPSNNHELVVNISRIVRTQRQMGYRLDLHAEIPATAAVAASADAGGDRGTTAEEEEKLKKKNAEGREATLRKIW